MAIRSIITEGDPMLTKRSRLVENFDERLAILVDDMIQTMKQSNGVGLAAPQVGVLRRVAVIDDGTKVTELINPEIIESSGEQEDVEGCLSCPGEYGITKRPMSVRVRAFDRNGVKHFCEGEALIARAICHELDHLEGILFKAHVIRMLDESEYEVN